jgi:hypothetical protein
VLRQAIGVSYKTAWYLCHRIRAALTDEGTDGVHRHPERSGPSDRTDAPFEEIVATSYRHLSRKHRPAYLSEMRFRQAHRDDADVFREILVRLLRTPTLSYADLTTPARVRVGGRTTRMRVDRHRHRVESPRRSR